jgi:hypothetical protein
MCIQDKSTILIYVEKNFCDPNSGRAIVIPLAIEFRVNLMIYFGS